MTQGFCKLLYTLLALLLSVFKRKLTLSILVLKWFQKVVKGGYISISPNVVQAKSIFILLRLQSCWSDFIFTVKFDHCTFNKIVFVIDVLQGSNFVLRKQKWTKWMKFRNWNMTLFGALGHVIMPCNMKTWICHLNWNIWPVFKISWNMSSF